LLLPLAQTCANCEFVVRERLEEHGPFVESLPIEQDDDDDDGDDGSTTRPASSSNLISLSSVSEIWDAMYASHPGMCCAVLCCAVLCCAVLCCAVLCCIVLYCLVDLHGKNVLIPGMVGWLFAMAFVG
jgi:hypothetical protein